LILPAAQYWVRNTDLSAPRYVTFSNPLSPLLSQAEILPQDPVLKNNQPTILPHCQRPSFSPILNNGQHYISIYFDLYVFG
jgi:hypothetical protein